MMCRLDPQGQEFLNSFHHLTFNFSCTYLGKMYPRKPFQLKRPSIHAYRTLQSSKYLSIHLDFRSFITLLKVLILRILSPYCRQHSGESQMISLDMWIVAYLHENITYLTRCPNAMDIMAKGILQ